MRISTGIPRLDTLMHGGFLERSFNLVKGTQGAGKTLFAVNYLLAHAKRGEEVLYISMEESWENIVKNLPERMKKTYEEVKQRVHHLDFSGIRPFLGKDVLDVNLLAEVITTNMTVHKANIIALDGIAPLAPKYGTLQDLRAAIFELSHRIKRAGGTMLFTSEGKSAGAEEYVADSVIVLYYDGRYRRIQILKMRGSDFIYGKHGFKISNGGLEVYPSTLPKARSQNLRMVKFGIKGMEKILGSIYTGDIILLTGPPGTGKTLMAYYFLNEAVKNGEKCVYISFVYPESVVLKRARDFGFNMNSCKIVYQDPFSLDPYEFMWKVFEESENATRVVLDGINEVEMNEETRRTQHLFFKNLKERNIVTLITYTTPAIISSYSLGNINVIYLADNIIDLRYAEIGAELRKVMVVVKSSTMNYERGIIEYDVGEDGIKLLGKAEYLEGIISGIPRRLEMKKRVEKFFK